MSSTIIPAQPGFFSLHIDAEPGEEIYTETNPIVAWCVESFKSGGAHAEPVTPTGSPSCEYLLCPDGRVFHDTSDMWFNDIAEAIGFEKQRAASIAGKALA